MNCTVFSFAGEYLLIRSMSVGKIFAGKQSAEFDSSSQAISASEKVLVPDNLDDDPRGFSQVDIFCHLCSLISELYTMHRQIVRG